MSGLSRQASELDTDIAPDSMSQQALTNIYMTVSHSQDFLRYNARLNSIGCIHLATEVRFSQLLSLLILLGL